MTAVMSSSQKPTVMVSKILLQRNIIQFSPFFVSSYEKDQNHLVTGDSIHLRYPGEHRLTLEDVDSVYEVSQRSSSFFSKTWHFKLKVRQRIHTGHTKIVAAISRTRSIHSP